MPQYRVLRGINYEPRTAAGVIIRVYRWEVGDIIVTVPLGLNMADLIACGAVEIV